MPKLHQCVHLISLAFCVVLKSTVCCKKKTLKMFAWQVVQNKSAYLRSNPDFGPRAAPDA